MYEVLNEPLVIENALPPDLVARALDQMIDCERRGLVDEYLHPFETKLQVKKEGQRTGALQEVTELLYSGLVLDWVGNTWEELPWRRIQPASDYFTAAYIYGEEDYLQTHLDCAIHGGERKVITAILYLNNCEGGELDIHRLTVVPEMNTLVVFANTIDSFHGVRPIRSGSRYMLTVGYALDLETARRLGEDFRHQNQKAFFVPAPGEEWTPQQYELAAERARP